MPPYEIGDSLYIYRAAASVHLASYDSAEAACYVSLKTLRANLTPSYVKKAGGVSAAISSSTATKLRADTTRRSQYAAKKVDRKKDGAETEKALNEEKAKKPNEELKGGEDMMTDEQEIGKENLDSLQSRQQRTLAG